MKKLVLAIIVIVFLAGCSLGNTKEKEIEFSTACISNNKKETVCYGDNRVKAEEVFGKGEKGEHGEFNYKNGVKIGYRDDLVARIRLDKDSEGKYSITPDIKVGVLQGKVNEVFGDVFISTSEQVDSYYYDTIKKEFITEDEEVPENWLDYMGYFFIYDENGYVSEIAITDVQLSMLGK
ncbi:MAG: hypothetical protein NAG76_22440 [Candidatus Pristimantibacillus lignocellulolyticus]|uniref:Lipoprotein n=1 Tax=Candidatus Pristimantibacillus lignocellulolyticus TaxID=2994561 RepID=A0A9J6ZEP3_9BACL|nr:MAG: hypothetical protein NAG76_22440 [Candidatus Pristimantibacillus lignocellulolyticus]